MKFLITAMTTLADSNARTDYDNFESLSRLVWRVGEKRAITLGRHTKIYGARLQKLP